MKPLVCLRRIGGFEEKGQGLDEIDARSLHGVALVGDVEFRAQGHMPVTFALDDGCQAARLLHPSTIANIYARSETFVFGMCGLFRG